MPKKKMQLFHKTFKSLVLLCFLSQEVVSCDNADTEKKENVLQGKIVRK